MIILDTNVVSELMRPAPAAEVVAWIDRLPPPLLHTTSIAQAEILHGIALLAAGKRRKEIEAAAASMFTDDFPGRILSFDSAAAAHYARIASDRRKGGRPISQFDAQIAAIVAAARATLATRNEQDFAGCGIHVVNPWTSA